MTGDIHVTLSGNLTAVPKSGTSRNGDVWARLRVACTPRVFDKGDNQWRDGATVFLDISCWRRLAENVVASLDRGDRIAATGRLAQRSYEDGQGVKHTVYELDADSVGPDLARTAARVLRPSGQAPSAAEALPEATPDVALAG